MSGPLFLVTGGTGFLGGHIVRALRERGAAVRVFDLRAPAEADRVAGVEYVAGDLCKRDDVEKAVAGTDAVFHVASLTETNGPPSLFEQINVNGTKALLELCCKHKVGAFVYTSSASVVFGGSDVAGVDEKTPYVKSYLDAYSETKMRAERIVLNFNGRKFDDDATPNRFGFAGLVTTSIRPHAMFGPGDLHFLPRMMRSAKRGAMRMCIGDGRNVVDFTYIDNAVSGHVLAMDAIFANVAKPTVAGKSYFITNGEPRLFWGFIADVCRTFKYPTPRFHINARFLYVVAWVLDKVSRVLKFLKWKPLLTPYVVRNVSTHHWFSIQAAKDDFGYEPKVSLKEGFARTMDYYRKNPI